MVSPLTEYRTVRELGSQSRRKFGRVFLLRHRETHEEVVLKIIPKQGISPETLALMRQETELPQGNAHFVPAFHLDENETRLLTLQRYVPGKNLDEQLAEVPLKQRRAFLAEFLPKLWVSIASLHEAGWLHCDLKPSNILLGNSGENAVYLIDLSLLHKRTNSEKRPVLYTLGYSSPELILHHTRLLGPASDYFSAGMIIYKILTGQLPLLNPNPAITTNLQLAHPLPEHDRLRKKELELLRALTCKPEFPTAPVKLTHAQQQGYLREAIENRISPEEFYRAWKAIPRKRSWKNWFR